MSVTKLVLSKIKATKQEREDVLPGRHQGSFLLKVGYDLNVGEDYPQRIVGKADAWNLLHVALSHLNGVTVQSIVREALSADPALVKSLKEQANKATAAIKETTWTDCKGKVTINSLDLNLADEVEIGHLVDALTVLTSDELARREA